MENALISMPDNSRPRVLDDHVKEIIHQTELQLRQLIAERKAVAKRIRLVKQTITGLANIFDESIVDSVSTVLTGRCCSRPRGITRACRQVLLEARGPLGLRDICDEVQRRAPALLARHQNAKAT